LIGRQRAGVRHSSCAESVSTGMKKATAWDERSGAQNCEPMLSPCEGDFPYTPRIQTLAETERLFDELTQEKQQAKIMFILKLCLCTVIAWEVNGAAVCLHSAWLKFTSDFQC